jgi:hypothetical protein
MTSLAGRTYGAGNFALQVDGGSDIAFLQSVEGGGPSGELHSHKMGPVAYEKKHMTTIKYEDLKFKTGIGMSKSLYEWMRAALKQGVLYKNGAVMSANFDGVVQRRMDCMNMLITEIACPDFDGSNKQSAYFTVTAAVEQSRWMKGDGSKLQANISAKQKAWHNANFRFSMAGLPTARVSTIKGLKWTCKFERDAVGEIREYTIHPTHCEVTDFDLTISAADLEPWAQKAEDWFIRGNCLEDHEMEATIEALSPNGEELCQINIMNVGFKQFNHWGQLEAATEKMSRFSVKLYGEQMDIITMGGAV